MFHVPPSPFTLRRELGVLLNNLAARQKSTVAAAAKHPYGCLLAWLPAMLAQQIVRWSQDTIAASDLGPGGLELEPHVTIKYGFQDAPTEVLPDLKALLVRHGPIDMSLEALAIFPGKDREQDVLYAAVASPQLHALHDEISRSFRCHTSYPDYVPHVTLAYLQPTVAARYALLPAPFCHQSMRLTRAHYRGADNTVEAIPLAFDNFFDNDKALSALDETSGAALVATAAQTTRATTDARPPPVLAR